MGYHTITVPLTTTAKEVDFYGYDTWTAWADINVTVQAMDESNDAIPITAYQVIEDSEIPDPRKGGSQTPRDARKLKVAAATGTGNLYIIARDRE